MHGSAAMAQRFLGESLWIPASFCTLRPGVPIRMQADADYLGEATFAAKFG